MAVEVRVDRTRCIGAKSCVYAAPRTFELDDQLIATVIDPQANPLPALLEAAETCPTGSISVFRDGERLA